MADLMLPSSRAFASSSPRMASPTRAISRRATAAVPPGWMGRGAVSALVRLSEDRRRAVEFPGPATNGARSRCRSRDRRGRTRRGQSPAPWASRRKVAPGWSTPVVPVELRPYCLSDLAPAILRLNLASRESEARPMLAAPVPTSLPQSPAHKPRRTAPPSRAPVRPFQPQLRGRDLRR